MGQSNTNIHETNMGCQCVVESVVSGCRGNVQHILAYINIYIYSIYTVLDIMV